MTNEKTSGKSGEPIDDYSVSKLIVFFDGVCNLCNGTVSWLIEKDRDQSLLFASLQSETAQQKLPEKLRQEMTSFVVLDGPYIYTQSDAFFVLLRHLKGWPRLLLPLQVVPRFLRDQVYQTVARNRYRWFGKQDTCRLPTLAEQKLFLP